MTVHIPLSLKMSAIWESEKASASIVPRICNLSITQVIFDRVLEDKIDNNLYFFVAVRMRDNSRRLLRSPELTFSSTIPGIVCLNFNCSIQYSHALKRDSSNVLQILIQRRKKYKKKSVNLGYKTLAYCTIDLAQVMQRKIENKMLDLYDDPKSVANLIGRIEVQSLSTFPAERDLVTDRRKDFFEEEDEGMHEQYSEAEDSDHADDSDDEQNCADYAESTQKKMMKAISVSVSDHHGHRRSSSPTTTLPEWQKQIKQKIMGLLRKVKLMEHNEVLDPRDQIWDEIDQFENASEDSDIGDMDTVSVQSTPRPTLRPFFSHTSKNDQLGADNSENTLNADSGAKLLKKLQLEGNDLGISSICNSNTVDVSLIGDKNRGNEGSETTEEETKVSILVKKNSYSQDRDTCVQVSKNKSKSSKSLGVSPVTVTNFKKDLSKPKAKQMSGKIKTCISSTAASTVPMISSVTPLQQKLLSSEGFLPTVSDCQIPGIINSTNPSLISSLMTSSTILSPITTEIVRDTATMDVRLSNDITPRSELFDQLNEFFNGKGESIDTVYLISLSDLGGKYVSELFTKEHMSHITVATFADVKFAMTQIINRIRKRMEFIRVCLLGSDCHLNNVLRVFVDQMNLNYSNEIFSCFRFFLIPIYSFTSTTNSSSSSAFILTANNSSNIMARRLCSIDSKYASLFAEFTQLENSTPLYSVMERDNKFLFGVQDYLRANGILSCPIGECLVACKLKQQSQESDPSTEFFIPFVSEVRLGEASEVSLNKLDNSIDDQWINSANNSPPRSPIIGNTESCTKSSVLVTSSGNIPSSMPNQSISGPPTTSSSFQNTSVLADVTSMELQLEYWTDHSSKKVSLKSTFRQVLVSPLLVNTTSSTQHLLSLTLISREKKQKIMRISKKPKHDISDSKRETFDDVGRILCTSKSQNSEIKITIDGVAWTSIKFFQLSPYWRTQIKTFPLATFNACA